MAQVTIYTTPTCGYCKAAKEYFKENNIDYSEKDVSTDDKAREDMITKSGQMGVPVIDIDGTLTVGFDKPAIAKQLGLG